MVAPFVSKSIIAAYSFLPKPGPFPLPQNDRRNNGVICCDKVGHVQCLLTSGADR
jgi:hypothetical protein